ncbi:hypothetical protein D3C71_1704670 [compost metagenome]
MSKDCFKGFFGKSKYTIKPVEIETARASPIRPHTTSGCERNATRVDVNTTGFRMGALRIKVIAMYAGIPFTINLRTTGIMPHSHNGRTIPSEEARITPTSGFLGFRRLIH